jgi:NADH pyrophosphatase NudC (nudix superfamily)
MDYTDADFFAAGSREVFEEVGLNIHPEEIYEQHKNETGDKIYITLWKRDYSINRKEIAFDANEVESVHWFNFDELLEMNADDFTPNTHKLLLKFLRRRDS